MTDLETVSRPPSPPSDGDAEGRAARIMNGVMLMLLGAVMGVFIVWGVAGYVRSAFASGHGFVPGEDWLMRLLVPVVVAPLAATLFRVGLRMLRPKRA